MTQPEYVADYVYALTACWGVFANLADDFRHLQPWRKFANSEIKRRPIQTRRSSAPRRCRTRSTRRISRNVKSMWKAYVPRLLTVLMDQISEHQRDLTNSASMRFVMEHVAAFAYAIHRLSMTLDGVEPDVARMREVLEGGKDPITAEPLYVLLAMHELSRAMRRRASPSAMHEFRSGQQCGYCAQRMPALRRIWRRCRRPTRGAG